jgi:hypothetical protein
MIRDSNSGIEAIESLATEFCSNPFGKDDFIQGIVDHYPILVELTKEFSMNQETDDSSDHDTVRKDSLISIDSILSVEMEVRLINNMVLLYDIYMIHNYMTH